MQRFAIQGAPRARVEQEVAAFTARAAEAMRALGGPNTCEETTFVFVVGADESFHDAAKALYQAFGPSKPAPAVAGRKG